MERTHGMIYSSFELIHYSKNTGNPLIDQDLKLHLQDLGILNTCIYFGNPRIFNMKTIIHSKRNSGMAASQRLISAGSNSNNCFVIHLGRHANKQRVTPKRITIRDQTFKRCKAQSARVIEPVPTVAPTLNNMYSNSSSSGSNNNNNLITVQKARLPSFYLLNACSLFPKLDELRLLPTFAGVLREKNCTHVSFSKTLTNYISKESWINVLYDENII